MFNRGLGHYANIYICSSVYLSLNNNFRDRGINTNFLGSIWKLVYIRNFRK